MEVLFHADLVKIVPPKVEKLNVPAGAPKAGGKAEKSSRTKV